ncbi:homocysteine S-methyltransferase [Nitzschia inconspicua]|uniref:Homocysteine S-methyltransferase n=1 Tax=Nitzschia inconspicua TaxID=303405 RepID=A0A9K3L294_9STRA|nr:homocysteine S-methyltransferase [Nitzschia inconspicua]
MCFTNATKLLPHQNRDVLYLTDSGLETQLIFKDGFDLPEFASFTLLLDQRGWEHCKQYYRRHAALVADSTNDVGFVFESMTWRASPDWLKKLRCEDRMQEIANKSIQLLAEVREEFPTLAKNTILSGTVGPRGDAYATEHIMSSEEAKSYHLPLIQAIQKAGADMVRVATLNNINEGIGIVLAAQEVGIPCVLSYTLETDGRLVTGESMKQVIETIDAATNNGPAYYMINCAHPTHFLPALKEASVDDKKCSSHWISRIGGVRGNASKRSHAELDNATELDEGNPEEFGKDNLNVMKLLPQANVFGGCCGTDVRHVESILSSYVESSQVRVEKKTKPTQQ